MRNMEPRRTAAHLYVPMMAEKTDVVFNLAVIPLPASLEQPRWASDVNWVNATVMAELLRPGTFARLVLVEPIIFPGPPYRRFEENPMSAAALKRRATFESAAAAFASYEGRGPFAGWDPAILQTYTEAGFTFDGDGGWTLKCPPEQEAEFYRGATLHGAWSRLGEIRCTVAVVGGADSTSHPREFLEAQAAQFPNAAVMVVPEATHFVPMERPGVIADLISGGPLG